jgi:starch phosphorylase
VYQVTGQTGYSIPVFFLDADLEENDEWYRTLTDHLYGGDGHYRFCQEAILGIGGVRMLRELGYDEVRRFHMNEGHASLLTLELLAESARQSGRAVIGNEDVEKVRDQCVFRTHTPVRSGHDLFSFERVQQVLGLSDSFLKMREVFSQDGVLNMTYLALNLSRYANGVAKKHGEVSRLMFAEYPIDSITNGVHAFTWVSQPFRDFFSRYIPDWARDNYALRFAMGIPDNEIWDAHTKSKDALIQFVNRETNAGFDHDVLTFAFARRSATYKRGTLLLSDLDRLRQISERAAEYQVIFAGKAHPNDQAGKEIIHTIVEAAKALEGSVRVAYLPNYGLREGGMMTSGVDLWLNTPEPPMEASGTSGMEAAMNGVPSLSVLDGCWLEGHIENHTGWSIRYKERSGDAKQDWAEDAASMYDKLEQVIIPMFYESRECYIRVMRHSIAVNGSFLIRSVWCSSMS